MPVRVHQGPGISGYAEMEMGLSQGPMNMSGVVVPLLAFVGDWSVVRPVSAPPTPHRKSVLPSLEPAPMTDSRCVLPSEGQWLCTSELQ